MKLFSLILALSSFAALAASDADCIATVDKAAKADFTAMFALTQDFKVLHHRQTRAVSDTFELRDPNMTLYAVSLTGSEPETEVGERYGKVYRAHITSLISVDADCKIKTILALDYDSSRLIIDRQEK